MDPKIINLIGNGILESLYMTIISTLASYLIGLPLGIILTLTNSKKGLYPNKAIYRVLDVIINVGRSVPFLILMVAIIPLTRLVVGTAIGASATIVPLTVAAIPFIARLVEQSLDEVEHGVIEAAEAMGASPGQIIVHVYLKEAMPSLILGATIALTTILGYSAMAGFVGGGGLGAIAINYGFYRYDKLIMLITVVLLVIIVIVFQNTGLWINKKYDHRHQ